MRWSDKVQVAFTATYAGELRQYQIAEQVGVTSRTLRNWQQDLEWKARYEALITAWKEQDQLDWKLFTLNERMDHAAELDTIEAAWNQQMRTKFGSLWKH